MSARVPAPFLTVSLGSMGAAIVHQTSHLSAAAQPCQQWPESNTLEKARKTCEEATVGNTDPEEREESGFFSLLLLFWFSLDEMD